MCTCTYSIGFPASVCYHVVLWTMYTSLSMVVAVTCWELVSVDKVFSWKRNCSHFHQQETKDIVHLFLTHSDVNPVISDCRLFTVSTCTAFLQLYTCVPFSVGHEVSLLPQWRNIPGVPYACWGVLWRDRCVHVHTVLYMWVNYQPYNALTHQRLGVECSWTW